MGNELQQKIPVERQYDKGLISWWFTHEYNNGKGVGSTWAAVRGIDYERDARWGAAGETERVKRTPQANKI